MGTSIRQTGRLGAYEQMAVTVVEAAMNEGRCLRYGGTRSCSSVLRS